MPTSVPSTPDNPADGEPAGAAAAIEFPSAFLDRLLRPLFTQDRERALLAANLLGAPLAHAAQTALGGGVLDATALRRAAQRAAITAKSDRAAAVEFCAALHEAGFGFVAFKGLATSLDLYPRPYYRLVPDVDLLFHDRDLDALAGFLLSRGFATRLDPGTVRRWGALTGASFAPVAPDDGAVYLDVHREIDDPPASRGIPGAAVFERAVAPAAGPATVPIPCPEHSFVILALHGFRDLYEPRGLKSLVDAALLIQRGGFDWADIERMASAGRFVRRLVFYRELLRELGAAPRPPLFEGRNLGPGQRRLLDAVSANFRSLHSLSVPDSMKLALEFRLYDSPETALFRNLRRVGGLFRPPLHTLLGLPVVREGGDEAS